MRSAEIARLAGVTVRTLRHYHQVGVLAERHGPATATANTVWLTWSASCGSGN